MEQTIYFEDVDAYGIVHHPRVLYFFERARTQYLNDKGFPVDKLPYGLILRKIQIRYKHPIQMHDRVLICQKVKTIDHYHFTLNYDILRNGCKMVQAEIDFVTVRLTDKKFIPLPDELRSVLMADVNGDQSN